MAYAEIPGGRKKPRAIRGKNISSLSLLGKVIYKFSQVALKATCFIFVVQAHFDASVDERHRTRKQFLCICLHSLAAKLLDRRTSGGHPVTIAQAAHCVLANPLLGTWVISHTVLSFIFCLNFRTANIGRWRKKTKYFLHFSSKTHLIFKIWPNSLKIRYFSTACGSPFLQDKPSKPSQRPNISKMDTA
jgi:hypothetical protein